MSQDTHETQNALGELFCFLLDKLLNERREEAALCLMFSAVKDVTVMKSFAVL